MPTFPPHPLPLSLGRGGWGVRAERRQIPYSKSIGFKMIAVTYVNKATNNRQQRFRILMQCNAVNYNRL